MAHQTQHDNDWFDSRYAGEDRDDGLANEMSLIPDPIDRRLNVLISNGRIGGGQVDATFSLTPDDAKQLVTFVSHWLNA